MTSTQPQSKTSEPSSFDTSTETVATGLMDATPIRIKRRHLGDVQADVRVVEPDSTSALREQVRQFAVLGEQYTIIGAQSNVVGALETGARTAISTRRLAGVRAFDPISHLVTIGAGTMGGDLEAWLNDKGFTLGQYPQSLHISTVGGWLNTRATGALSARNGGIENAVRGAVVILPDGEQLTFEPRVRPAGGFDGLAAFLGGEGSLGIVTEVTLQVQSRLPELSDCFLFEDLESVIEAQRDLVQQGYPVALLRGYNIAESNHVLGDDASPGCLLMVSTVGPQTLVAAQIEAISSRLVTLGGTVLGSAAAERWYAERYQVETMMEDRNSEPGRAFDTIEVSVPWGSAVACAQEMETAMSKFSSPFYLHFSHAYETGVCFYSLLWIEDADGDDAVLSKLRAAWRKALEIVRRHGGTGGHHHGIGAVRASEYAQSPDARVHKALKSALDPAGHLLARLIQ